MILSIVYLLFVGLGFGFGAWKLLNLKELEGIMSFFIYLATGIVIFVQTSTLLGFLHLSNWFTYLALAIALLVAAFWKGGIKVEIAKPDIGWWIVIVIFIIHLYVYVSGAFGYPWLEDDDPWEHASAVRYVSLFNTYIQPPHLPIHYLAPYPPFFDVLLGVLFQVDGQSLQSTLKFFNALLVSLSIPFFYCWAKEKFDGRTALWATFVLAALPSFMSHFIWAQTLCVMLVFPALYFVEKYLKATDDEKMGFSALTVLSSASVFITQPSSAVMFFGLIVAYIFAHAVSDYFSRQKNLWERAKILGIIVLAALVLALAQFWIPMFMMYTKEQVFSKLSLSVAILTQKYEDTGGGLVYGFSDFFEAQNPSKMDQPIGWGIVVFLLVIVGLGIAANELRKGKWNVMNVLMLVWFVYGMIGTEGNLFPLKLVPHRFWVFLAIPVALIAAKGTVSIAEYLEARKKGAAHMAVVLIVLGILLTSAAAKQAVETSQWPPGIRLVFREQIFGYVQLKNLAPNTKVFSFCMPEDFANGMDKFGYAWDKDVAGYKNFSVWDTNDGNYRFLKKYGYEYMIIDQACVKMFDQSNVEQKVKALIKDPRFQIQQQLSNQGFIVFKVV